MHVVKHCGLLLTLVIFVGCGSGNPSTVKVTGTVTYKGVAVEGASVVFAPATGGGSLAAGKTDAAGKFTLTTFDTGDGAVPGSYTVAISKVVTIGGMNAEDEHDAAEAGKAVSSTPVSKSEIPAKYGDSTRSGLKEDVTAEGPNEFTFELTD